MYTTQYFIEIIDTDFSLNFAFNARLFNCLQYFGHYQDSSTQTKIKTKA